MKKERRKVFVWVCIFLYLLLFAPRYFAYAFPLRVSAEPQFVSKANKYVPGEILVKFREKANPKAVDRINLLEGGQVILTSLRGKFSRVKIPAGRTVEEMVKRYRRYPEVEYAEPNYLARVFYTPNDPYYSYQWHFPQVRMSNAWEIELGGKSSVVVAVVDTGIAYEDYDIYAQAPDLAGTNFVVGYDFVNNDTHPNDDNRHGTHVAGTVAQTTNNGAGVAGVAFSCSLMPVKVFNADGYGTYAQIADGFYYAVDNGAHVINFSGGGPADSSVLHDAVKYAYNKGVPLIAAAGNDGTSTLSYPAAYPEAIAVAAVRYDKTLSYYSNYGSGLDLVAPGGDLNVDQNGDGYADGVLQQTFASSTSLTNFGYYFFQGTSMAAPHVSGVVALLIAHGESGVDNIYQILTQTAEDLGTSGYDTTYGYGLVNAAKALDRLAPESPPKPTPKAVSAVSGEFEWSPAVDNEKVSYYKIFRNVSGDPDTFELIDTTTATSYTDTLPSPASWWYRVSAVDFGGNESSLGERVHMVYWEEGITKVNGGVISIDGGRVRVEVPADSLPADTTITVETKGNPPPPPPGLDAGGTVYELGPGGLTFSKGVTITLSYFRPEPEGLTPALFYYNPATSNWEYIGGEVDKTNNRVSALVNHFSTFGVFWGNALQGPHGGYTSTTDKCKACHDVHQAVGTYRLLPANTIYDTCQSCHDGTGAENVVYGQITGFAGGPPEHYGHRMNTGIIAIPGGDTTVAPYGPDSGLTCSSCHSPHGSETRMITEDYYCDATATVSNHLLLRDPGRATGTVIFYGAKWCADCHDRRHNERAGIYNHPVSLTLSYLSASIARDNSNFQMSPVNPSNTRTDPICQHCHEDARDVETTFTVPNEPPPTPTNPKYNNFPHEAENRYMVVETGDDLCLNCHSTDNLP